MSVNIHIIAIRTEYTKDGQPVEDRSNHFGVVQTPSSVTWAIMDAHTLEEKIRIYKEYVQSAYGDDEVIPVYADDDPDENTEPVDTRIENFGRDHLKQLDEWIESVTKMGCTIITEAL